jgi:uncharacterized protein YcbK (DUF882 family)
VLRAGVCLCLASVFVVGGNNALQTAVAEGDTRTLSFHHLHTGEDITITFKRDGRYDDAALKKLDWFMRDWRKEQSTGMDPHLFDLLWEAYREVGGSEAIQVVCGYRSPETNSMLRARSSGVAQTSQHTEGHAMDFFIPGVPLDKLRTVGLRLQRGGVGFYPTSGSPFVHLDTGTVRHWPRMTHDQLAKVFPDGRTVHVPSDGVPLPGYALALADVESRGGAPSSMSLEAARANGVDVAAAGKTKSLFAALFGRGTKDADEVSEEAAPKAANLRQRPVAVASVTPPKPVEVERIVPLPPARPVQVAAAMPKAKPAMPGMALASLPSTNVFDNRGYWRGAVETGDLAPPAKASPFEVASADATVVGSTPQAALAYAATETPMAAPAKLRPMGAAVPSLPAAAIAANTTLVEKPALRPSFTPTLSGGAQTFDSPWLRAAMLTLSVNGFMTATQLGAADTKALRDLMQKPAQAVVMTFAADPLLGMVAERFSGSAVVFLATATFTTRITASLR